MLDDLDVEDCLEQIGKDPEDFEYLEGSDVEGADDTFATGKPLHGVYSSAESRVMDVLLGVNGPLDKESLENLSGISGVEDVTDKLVEEGVVEYGDEGYVADRDNQKVEQLMDLRADLVNTYREVGEGNYTFH